MTRGGPGDRRGGPPVDQGGPGDRRGGPPVNRGGPGDRGTRRLERRPTDLIWLVAGAVVLVLCALPVHADRVDALEGEAFRLVNDLPDVPFAIVWVPMQLGNFLIVPAAVLAALAFRRWRLAAGLALAGAGVYVLAKVVKRFVERGRPSDVLDDVLVRGAAPHGLGFVSGHIAVISALALVAWPWLPRWGRWAAGLAVAAVFLTRMYVGAHLPLDMVGGAALGVAVGALVRLLLGVPAHSPGPAGAAEAAAPDARKVA
jgi:membrane-associated phospholipid phosphatase